MVMQDAVDIQRLLVCHWSAMDNYLPCRRAHPELPHAGALLLRHLQAPLQQETVPVRGIKRRQAALATHAASSGSSAGTDDFRQRQKEQASKQQHETSSSASERISPSMEAQGHAMAPIVTAVIRAKAGSAP